MIEVKESERLNELAEKLNDAWCAFREDDNDEGAEAIKEALEKVVFPGPDATKGLSHEKYSLLLKEARKQYKNAWIADNDHEGMCGMGHSMLVAGLQIASLLKEGESVFQVDLCFGGEVEHESSLFLSGTEDAVASLLQGVVDQFPMTETEDED